MSVLPRIALFLQYVLPRNSRNTQNLLTVYSPTDCTLLYVLPRNSRNTQNLLAVYSPTDFTDLHRTFLPYILPQNSRNTQNLLAVYSPTDCTDFHRCCFQGVHLSQVHQPVLLLHFLLCWCTSCSVGALETSAPPESSICENL